MRKRLRKKLRRGEFRELGFVLRFSLPPEWDQDQMLEFWDRFITEAIEANELYCGGSSGHSWDVMVCRAARASATEEDRKLVDEWLSRDSSVSNIRVGRLADAWYTTPEPADS